MSDPKPMWIVQVKGHWRGRDGGWRPALGTAEESAFYSHEAAEQTMHGFILERQYLCLDATFRLFQVEELPEMLP